MAHHFLTASKQVSNLALDGALLPNSTVFLHFLFYFESNQKLHSQIFILARISANAIYVK